MKHLYQYQTVVNIIPLKGTPDFTDEKVRVGLVGQISKTLMSIPKLIDALPDHENWEVNSHSISQVGDALILSILFQRRNS